MRMRDLPTSHVRGIYGDSRGIYGDSRDSDHCHKDVNF